MNQVIMPSGTTHVHLHLTGNQQFERWVTLNKNGAKVVYNWTGTEWVFHDVFRRSDAFFRSMRKRISLRKV